VLTITLKITFQIPPSKKSCRFGNLFVPLPKIFGMKVVAKKILRKFWEKHSDSEHQLKTWK